LTVNSFFYFKNVYVLMTCLMTNLVITWYCSHLNWHVPHQVWLGLGLSSCLKISLTRLKIGFSQMQPDLTYPLYTLTKVTSGRQKQRDKYESWVLRYSYFCIHVILKLILIRTLSYSLEQEEPWNSTFNGN